ncbi:hypothetical protein ACSBR1_033332 [Camellia fascicularis]
MTLRKLKKVLKCNDFDPELSSKVVLEALFFKAEAPYRQHSLVAQEANAFGRWFVERVYKYRLVKVMEFELPHQQCVVYLDLKWEECVHLFPSGRVYSQANPSWWARFFPFCPLQYGPTQFGPLLWVVLGNARERVGDFCS